MSKPVRILLVEDHDIVREGLRSLVDTQPGYLVVAEASNGRQALTLARTTTPQVVILDINLPELNGIEATRLLRASFPALKVIGLSVHNGGRLVSEMIEAGAAGYLPKSCAGRELFSAIDAVMSGRMYISPTVNHSGAESTRNPLAPLTPRERQVMQLLAEGRSTKEVAAALGLIEVTAHTHRQNLMRKLKCRSIADLTRLAIREGVTSLDYT